MPLESYTTFASTDLLAEQVVARMLAGISTRRYPVALEPVGEPVEQVAPSTSKSAVSRRFVTATAERLAELSARPLGDQRWLIVFIDGFSFADHTLVGALGVTADTRRETSPITYPKPSARWSSASCGRRGPSHRLPKPRVTWRALARSLARQRPGAAASLREGLDDTLTVNRLGVTGSLLKTVDSTNPVESTIGIVRDHSRRVKRWSSGEMALRWAAAGMLAAQTQFRRVKRYLQLPALARALEQHVGYQPDTHDIRHAATA